MACSACGSESTIAVSVPEEYREYAPDAASVVRICSRCLTVGPVAADAVSDRDDGPDFSSIGEAFPTRPASAVPLALALDLCSSLATNREAIEALLLAVEHDGTDPLLVIDRLASDSSIEPAIDLERRRHQLEQLLY